MLKFRQGGTFHKHKSSCSGGQWDLETHTDQTYFLKKVIIGIMDIWEKDESISLVSLLALLGGYGIQWERLMLNFFFLMGTSLAVF